MSESGFTCIPAVPRHLLVDCLPWPLSPAFVCWESYRLCLQDFGQDVGEGLNIWLQSRDPAALKVEAERHGGKVSVVLDGQKRLLQAGRHVHLGDQTPLQSA